MRRRAAGRGFTLIELMIALTISSLLVAMILQIFTRLSGGYRSQQSIAELQRRLSAGQSMIQRDVRQAGFQLIDGFKVAGATATRQPVEILDNSSGFGPDELHVFYADASAQARVLTFPVAGAPLLTFTVDDPDRFGNDELVVLTNRTIDVGLTPPASHNRACVVQITSIAGTVFTARVNGAWGTATNAQCDEVRAAHGGTPNTMAYRFVAHGYRIDPTRRELGILQLSLSGGLLDDWQDLGVGFTDLQLASRWYEGEDTSTRRTSDTADLDTDPQRDWYSGPDQTTLSAPLTTFTTQRPLPMELRVTLVVRTRNRLDAVASAATPVLTDASRPSNNDLGNRTAVTLAGVADASRPAELRGDALFRYATVGSDLRNLAVGR